MAKEIYMSSESTDTLYAIVYQQSDGKVWNGSAFEAWVDGNIGTYDIAMTASGDMFFGDFPAVPEVDGASDKYIVQVRKQLGASPAITDDLIGQGFMEWGTSGGDETTDTGEVTSGSIAGSNSIASHDYPENEDDLTLRKARIYL